MLVKSGVRLGCCWRAPKRASQRKVSSKRWHRTHSSVVCCSPSLAICAFLGTRLKVEGDTVTSRLEDACAEGFCSGARRCAS